jgi:hypothetical protein
MIPIIKRPPGDADILYFILQKATGATLSKKLAAGLSAYLTNAMMLLLDIGQIANLAVLGSYH